MLYSEIEDKAKEVQGNFQKVFDLITEYEKEKIDPEEIEELQENIEDLKRILKDSLTVLNCCYDYYAADKVISEDYAETIKDQIKEIEEATKEGKFFYEQYQVGAAKYVVNHFDGIKKHRDGSPFYDIEIFKSKKESEKFIIKLLKEGYSRI